MRAEDRALLGPEWDIIQPFPFRKPGTYNRESLYSDLQLIADTIKKLHQEAGFAELNNVTMIETKEGAKEALNMFDVIEVNNRYFVHFAERIEYTIGQLRGLDGQL